MTRNELAPFNTVRVIENAGGRLAYRKGSGGTVEILDIVVSARRTGYGRRLIQRLVDGHGVPIRLWAFTRESNGIARDFYKALGFRESIVPAFYQEEAAVLVARTATPNVPIQEGRP